MKKIFLIWISVCLLNACGGGSASFTSLKKPVSIAASTSEIMFEGRETQFVYVADQYTQSIIVIDTAQEKIVDTAGGDDFDFSPLPIGGEPTAIAVDDTHAQQRVYVSDQFNNQIIAYQIESTISSSIVHFKPLSLGATSEGKSSRYLFKNSGAQSSPTITNIIVDPAVAKNESWILTYKGNGEYEVKGSESGIQTKIAHEGATYKNDDEAIQFYISPGGERTTKGDIFYFSSYVAKPLQLTSSPVDLIIFEDKLYILTKNDPSIVVFDLDTLNVLSTTVLPASMPERMFFHDDKMYVSNISSGDIYSFDINSLVVTTISTTLPGIKYVGANDDHLFLIHSEDSKLSIANHSGVISKTLNLNDFGNFFFTKEVDGRNLGLVPNISGNVDVIDMDDSERFDTEDDDKPDFLSLEFFDVGAISKPQLISVDATAGKTLNETWQLIFDSTSDTYIVTGSKSGLQTNQVTPGEAYTSDHDEISLRIRPSFVYPETEGDFFTFLSLDPIDPILISNQSMAVGGVALDRISDGNPRGYIIQQANGQVSIVDLTNFNVKKTL